MNSQTPARPAIKDIVSGQSDIAVSTMSEHEVANLLAPLTPPLSGRVFYGTMKVGQALGNALGIKSNQKVEQGYFPPTRYETVVLAYFLAIRQNELQITALYDTLQGSGLEARLPTDIFSLGGRLQIEIIDESPSQILVCGSTEVKGQMFDWGKGNRILHTVCDSAQQYLRKMHG